MTEFNLKLADVVFHVSALYESTKRYCEGYLADETAGDFIDITLTEEIISAEREVQIREGNYVAGGANLADEFLEPLALYRKAVEILIDYNTVMFHGSAIAVDGEVYIFTALSGTGKSTHTSLWRKLFGDRAVMVNDDKPLITVNESGVTVHGTPWNGKHKLGTRVSLPLKAICILERDRENHITRISAKELYPMAYQQTYRTKNPKNLVKTLAIIDKMTRSVGCYRLGCNMDPDAARVSYEGMQK